MLLSAIVILLIIFSVLPALLFSVPAIQNATIDRAAEYASKYLSTRVEVGEITVGVFNRVVVRDFYVEDFDGDTLLYVKRADATVGPISSLLKKNLVLRTGKISGGKFILRETDRDTYNVKEITDQLINRNRRSSFRMDIGELTGNDIEFRLHRKDDPRDEGIDFANMYLLGIDVKMEDFVVLGGGIVKSKITSLSFMERTGFRFKDMQGRFEVNNGKIRVDKARLRSEQSDISLDYLLLDGKNWLEYRDFINKVPIVCHVSRSMVSSEDVGYFAPSIWKWKTVVYNTDAIMDGTVADFTGRLDHLELENGGELRGTANVKGLVDVEKTDFKIEVERLDASTNEITYLLNNIAEVSFDKGDVMKYLDRIGRVNASGSFNGTIRDFQAEARAFVASGGVVELNCNMKNPIQGRKEIEINSASVENLCVNHLVLNNKFGKVTASLAGNAEIGGGDAPYFDTVVSIDGAELFGYNLCGANIAANTEGESVRLNVEIQDRALVAHTLLPIVVDWSDGPDIKYSGNLRIDHADLHAMNINRRDSVSVLSGDLCVNVHGSMLDNMNGQVVISDAKYISTKDRACVVTEPLVAKISSKGKRRRINIKSNFADIDFDTSMAYKDVVYDLKHLLVPYAPNLYKESERGAYASHLVHNENNVAKLSVVTKESLSSLLACISNGLSVAKNSEVKVTMNPSKNLFNASVKSDYIEYNNNLATRVNVSVKKERDSLMTALSTRDLYVGVLYMPAANIIGGIRDNKISLNANFNDALQAFSGQLSADMSISRRYNRPNFTIKLNPSHLAKDKNKWDITTDGIRIDSSRIDVNRFYVRNETQKLLVDGVISPNDNDSLYVEMKDFSLSPVTQITQKIGYVIDGYANGYATIHSAMKDTRINARIGMDSVDISGMRVPDLDLISKWDFGSNQAKLNIYTRRNGVNVANGYFMPSKLKYLVGLDVKGVDMGILDPMLKGIITETEGSADINVKLEGEKRKAELSGNIKVHGLATTIDYTKCRYHSTVDEINVNVKNNVFKADTIPVADDAEGKGVATLEFSLEHLYNIKYNVGIKVNAMQVLNTTVQDNSMFYGSVYASGVGSINGDKSGVKMVFNATSEDDSKFFMPLTSDDQVAMPKYVSFVTPRPIEKEYTEIDSLISRRKRRMTGSVPMDLQMTLDVRPNAEVQLVIDPTVGDIIKGTGEGKFDMHYNSLTEAFEMQGTYMIKKGSYLFTLQNVINKRFEIQPDSEVRWSGDPLDATLDINAVYKLKTSLQPLLVGSLTSTKQSSRAVPVECYIHLTDKLMHPSIEFDISVPSADSEVQSIINSALATPESMAQQFAYLIVTNNFISETTNSFTSSLGASATVATGMELLSNQLSNWFSNESDRIIMRYRPRTPMLSDEVDFGFSKGLINNRLLVEVEGNYIVDKTQVVNANSNFTGEAYLTWIIDNDGSLRLKGFTHTIDRFDENQGLQETGLGIYFSEEFNNAKDLKERLKNRFRKREPDSIRVAKREKKRKNNSK